MLSEENLKDFKQQIEKVLEDNNFACLVCIQNIDTGFMTSANLNDLKVMWKKKQVFLYASCTATFLIPYIAIENYHKNFEKQIEIFLKGRILISIREAQ
jgi:hypothetical protein